MKIGLPSKHQLVRALLLLVGLVFAGFTSPLLSGEAVTGFCIERAHAESVNDVESDVDSVISNSIQARTEAAQLRRQDHEEKLAEEKLRLQAIRQIHEAKIKQAIAKRQIGIYDRQIAQERRMERLYKHQIEVSKKWVAEIEAKVSATKTRLKITNSELQMAKTQKTNLAQKLAQQRSENLKLQNTVEQDKVQTEAIARDIIQLRRKQKVLNDQLRVLREKAFRADEAKNKMRTARNQIQRQVSSIPTEVIARAPKYNCDVLAQADGGANKIGEIYRGHRYALYQVINGWVEVQVGSKRGYVSRSCF